MSRLEAFPSKRTYGLELQEPFAELLISGKKTIETRLYPLPESLLYKHVVIIESSKGEEGRSGLGDCVALNRDGESRPRCIGTVVFSECFEYTSEEQWRGDSDAHLVPAGSIYDWTPDSNAPIVEEVKKEPVIVKEASLVNPKEAVKSGQVWLTAGDKAFKPLSSYKRRKRAQAPAVRDKSDRRTREAPGSTQGHPVTNALPGPQRRVYGWRVLGAFRAHLDVPSILRVHRSIFDCGDIGLALLDGASEL
jgi:hypothetical protein